MPTSSYFKNLTKRSKCYLITSICIFVIVIIFFAFLFLKPHFSKMVDNIVKSEVQFTKDNADVWAEFPGKNDIIIVNNITFLHHRNLNEGKKN